MNISAHLRNLRESIEEIENAIKIGIKERQRTIGFHTSAAAVDMLEIMLHKGNLIDPGFIIKHDWFTSKNKINEKFSFDFKNKKEILETIINIEKERNKLCYGKAQSEDIILKVIENFNRLKKEFGDIINEKI